MAKAIKVSQESIEIGHKLIPKAFRIYQGIIEVGFGEIPKPIKINQELIEIGFGQHPKPIRVFQQMIEIGYRYVHGYLYVYDATFEQAAGLSVSGAAMGEGAGLVTEGVAYA